MNGIKCIKIAGCGVLGAVLVAEAAEGPKPEYTSERYELITERSPFGADPFDEDVAQEREDAAAVAAATKELRLCFLLESESGEIRAGFQRKGKVQQGESKSVILLVGESFMGMKLLEIDLPASKATLQSKGKPVIFELSKAPAIAKAPVAKPAKAPQRKFGGGFRRKEPPKPAPPPEPKLSPEEQRRRREEIRANLQDYQMEVIRSGMPPLPIPLTQEMDDQLVSEGVLAPSEEDFE